MSIASRENALFDRWRKSRPDLVADGVTDESAYLASHPRQVYVLKEANDPGGGGWDSREFLRAGARPQTWDNIARWARGIGSLPADVPWSSLERLTAEDRARELRSVCAMNLGKSPGGHTADPLALRKTALDDREFIREQLGLYEAELVICCGSVVSEILHEVLGLEGSFEWQATRRGVRFCETLPGQHLVEFTHPEARVPSFLLHYGLVDAVREIRAAGR